MECLMAYYHDVNNKQAYLKKVKNSTTLNNFDFNTELNPPTLCNILLGMNFTCTIGNLTDLKFN